jgi:hypothetical protein
VVEGMGAEGEEEVVEDQGHTPNVFKSAKGDEIWQKERLNGSRKYSPQNVMTMQPGPTAYAIRLADTIVDTLQLFLTPQISGIILTMSNKEGEQILGEIWIAICEDELNAFFGLSFLAGVYRSAGEATEELWDFNDGVHEP